MKLYVQGKGPVRLEQADFVAQGGEASVYARDDLAFKIYTDPRKMIPTAKIQELSVLTHSNIVTPRDILLDQANTPVGYTMLRVQRAEPLCRLFTRAFRDRKGVSPDAVIALVRRFQETVEFIHRRGMLIVDLNEMNFLLDSNVSNILCIDVDSYQTPGFPPTAIMDSIRDRHAANFSVGTDWFSFAVVTFQMFVGIHPYKGKHAGLTTLDSRMLRNVSVFHPDVTIPAACYPPADIPKAYQDWYKAVFDRGVRTAPPDDMTQHIVLTPRAETTLTGDRLTIDRVDSFPGEIVFIAPEIAADLAVTTGGLYLRGRQVLAQTDVRLITTPRERHVIAVGLEAGTLRLYDLTADHELPRKQIAADAYMTTQQRLYVKNGAEVYEAVWLELPAGVQCALKPAANVLAQAARVFDGVVFQNLLGVWHATLFPKPGACYTVRLPELNGAAVVDARFEWGVLMLVVYRQGQYDRLILRFDAAYDSYDVRTNPDVPAESPNFVTLENGICLHLNEQNELEVFPAAKGAQSLRVLNEAALRGARLAMRGTQAMFTQGDTLYRMTLRAST